MNLVVKRRPKVGDYVRSKSSGRVYLVRELIFRWDAKTLTHVGVDSVEDGLPNAFERREVETLSTLVATDLTLRELAGDRCTTAKAVAKQLWPDSPGWHRSSNVGRGSATGVGPPRAAGVELGRLVKLGAARSCGPLDHSDGWGCYGYRPVGKPLTERA